MKRTIITILVLTAGSALLAQQPAPQANAPAPEMIKVGIINMLQLYSKCDRVQDLKKRMETQVKPFTKKKEELEELVLLWQKAFKNTNPGLKPHEREQGQKIVIECRRQLEDLEFKFKKEVAKPFEEETDALTKYLTDSIKYYSSRQGYQLVLAYGEPETPLAAGLVFQRNIAAMDKGYIRPAFYYPGSIDITQELINAINAASQNNAARRTP